MQNVRESERLFGDIFMIVSIQVFKPTVSTSVT